MKEVSYFEFFNEAPLAFLLLTPAGEIKEANRKAAEMLGYMQQGLCGLRLTDLFAQDAAGIHRIHDLLARPNQATSAQVLGQPMRPKDGRVLWVDIWLAPVLDSSEQLVALRVALVDMSTQRDSADALRNAEQRQEAVLNALLDVVVCINAFGTIGFVSDSVERVFGWQGHELIGKNVSILMPEPHRSNHDSYLANFRDTRVVNIIGKTRAFDAVRKDGTLFPCDLSVSQVGTASDEDEMFTGVIRDLTEATQLAARHRALEAKLVQAQKMESLGVLAGGIAHDFNNMLTGILGNASFALIGLPPESTVREVISDIEKSAMHAAELTRQLLAYSGHGKFVTETFSLSTLVKEMGHLLEVSISKSTIIKYEIGHTGPIHADISQIRQVVMNLIINASEAIADRSGVISIRLGIIDADEGYLAGLEMAQEIPAGLYTFLEVADTGCGMDAATRQRIFDPFFTTKFTGRGLGLAAVLGIVRAHQGALRVYSEPERGTTFKVLLPICDSEMIAEFTASNEILDWKTRGLILVVDDEETIRTVMKRTLNHAGFEVIMAADGREGLAIFAEKHASISLVILDLTMPHMDGKEACQKMLQIDRNAAVIFTSGYSEDQVERALAGRRYGGFLQKPFSPEALLTLARSVLEQPVQE